MHSSSSSFKRTKSRGCNRTRVVCWHSWLDFRPLLLRVGAAGRGRSGRHSVVLSHGEVARAAAVRQRVRAVFAVARLARALSDRHSTETQQKYANIFYKLKL